MLIESKRESKVSMGIKNKTSKRMKELIEIVCSGVTKN